MKRTWMDFPSLRRNFVARRLIVPASACLAIALGVAIPIQADTFPVTGTAGFETGLQHLAFVTLDKGGQGGDGATVFWGDLTKSPGLYRCFEPVLHPNQCHVYGTHRYTVPGMYTITIAYNEPRVFGTGPEVRETTTATISPVRDFVILSIGDSVASGEGNPAVAYGGKSGSQPNEGFWDDAYSNYPVSPFPDDEAVEWPHQTFPCHRSSLAGPAQASLKVQLNNPGVTFVHYACSGAKVTAGDTPKDTVQDAVSQLRVARGRLPRIDVLLISAGTNSFTGATFGSGFGELLKYCILHPLNPCSENEHFKADVTNSLNALPNEYAKLGKEINCINPDDGTREPNCTDPQKQIPKIVLITEYMDPTHNRDGDYPSFGNCPVAFEGVSQSEWQFFHDFIVHPLNQQVDRFPSYAQGAGSSASMYAVTGIEEDFLRHGLCAGGQKWVFNDEDSHELLGPGPHPDLEPPNPKNHDSGTGHPISVAFKSDLGLESDPCCGQEDYRDRIYDAMVQYNVPITKASATTGGAPYAFGTWTVQDVVVTLSATNAIKESGVKQTLYAVDDTANCQPVTWPRCSIYGGPFTISTSGKHTVTFDSQNTSGWMGPFQNVQVWVDNEPPVMTCSATPSVLWPPNNKMVPVQLNVTAVSAAFGPTPFSLKSVATSEGNAATDIQGFVIGQPSTQGSLRASRLGHGMAGRVYTFIYQSTDELGLTGTCTAKVQEPHDQGRSNR